MLDSLLEPFQYRFFVQGLVAALLVGGLAGLLGVFIVLRRMAYIGHGLSHAAIGGAVVSYVFQLNFYLGAGAWGFLTALIIAGIARRFRLSADAVIGAVTTASFALGVAIMSRMRTFTRNFEAALFGDVLGVTPQDLVAIGVVAALTLGVVLLLYKEFLFTTFDPEVARVYGVPAERSELLLALVLAATVIVSMQVIGVTLLAAAIVVPPLIARLLTHSFHRVVVLSTLLGVAFGGAGMFLSFYLDIASGATVVLVATAAFAVAIAYVALRQRLRGLRPVGVHGHRHEEAGVFH